MLPDNCLPLSSSRVTPSLASTVTPSQLVMAVATSQSRVAVPARVDSMSSRTSQSRATSAWALASEAVGLVVAQPWWLEPRAVGAHSPSAVTTIKE